MTFVLNTPAAEASAVGPNTLKAKALHTVLSDVAQFAAPASARSPELESVRLEAAQGQLVAVAMDRSALGTSRVDYGGAAFSATIAVPDAKALAALAKTGARDEKWREVTVAVADDGAMVTFRFTSGEALTVRTLDVSYPKWRQMFPANDAVMGGIVGTGYEPARLVKFTKVRLGEWGATVVAFPSVTSSGRPGPTVIQVGAGFIGLLMPKGADGDLVQYDPPGWLHETTSAAARGAGQVA